MPEIRRWLGSDASTNGRRHPHRVVADTVSRTHQGTGVSLRRTAPSRREPDLSGGPRASRDCAEIEPKLHQLLTGAHAVTGIAAEAPPEVQAPDAAYHCSGTRASERRRSQQSERGDSGEACDCN